MLQTFLDIPPDSPFPLQNLPYGVFSPDGGRPRAGAAIGDFVLDLAFLEAEGLLPTAGLFDRPALNAFMAAGPAVWARVRETLQELLAAENPLLRDHPTRRRRALHPRQEVTLHLPAQIGDYTDFYSSREHATNVGTMFRGVENALPPNWRHLPIAYHGRSSSIAVSGTPVRRPCGQTRPAGSDFPVFGPTAELDFELEVGVFIGPGNPGGEPISPDDAGAQLFGLVLVNDWSARDIQRWEYQPLGPFLAKNFATSISPWVVPLAALEPFRTNGPAQDPPPLPYLAQSRAHSYDIDLEVRLQPAGQENPAVICRTNFKYLYWSMAQQVAHHTVTGCPLRPGDLLASGTISGPEPDTWGSLLELSWNGKRPVTLPGGASRAFLEDGDMVILSGGCRGDGYRIGFGDVTGEILPARTG